MKLKQTAVDDAGGSIFTDKKGKPILNIQFSMDLTMEEVKELITYIENFKQLP